MNTSRKQRLYALVLFPLATGVASAIMAPAFHNPIVPLFFIGLSVGVILGALALAVAR